MEKKPAADQDAEGGKDPPLKSDPDQSDSAIGPEKKQPVQNGRSSVTPHVPSTKPLILCRWQSG